MFEFFRFSQEPLHFGDVRPHVSTKTQTAFETQGWRFLNRGSTKRYYTGDNQQWTDSKFI